MSKLIIALTTVTVASAGASTWFWHALHAEREQTAALQARIEQLERARERVTFPPPPPAATPRDEPVQTDAVVADASPSEQQSTARVGFVAAPGAVFSAVSGPRSIDPEMRQRLLDAREQQRRMLQNPEYRELMRTQHKLNMQQHYADLESLLGLSKEESDQLIELLAEQAVRGMEDRPMFREMDGTPPTEAEMREQRRLFEERHRKNESEIAALLGPKYGEWQQYQQNGWARSQVTRLRQTLALTDEPLRPDQIKPLVEAIAREQQQQQQLSGRWAAAPSRNDPLAQARMAEEWLERTAQTHERIRMAVSGLLTPRQYEQLERQQQQELKMQELGVKQQRARAEAQARGELPPDPMSGPMPGMINSITTYTR